jgi:hypothetical protein
VKRNKEKEKVVKERRKGKAGMGRQGGISKTW